MVGYVPDQPYLYDKLTGREFLRFTAELYGLSREDADQSIEDQIQAFGLADFVDELTESYSHGMKQRVVSLRRWSIAPKFSWLTNLW